MLDVSFSEEAGGRGVIKLVDFNVALIIVRYVELEPAILV